MGHQLWLHGPSWLRQPSKEWPKDGFGYEDIPEGALPELKVHIAVEATPTWSINSNSNAEEIPRRNARAGIYKRDSCLVQGRADA